MKCVFISVGKDKDHEGDDLRNMYERRILKYVPFEWIFMSHDVTKEKEGDKILSYIKKEDYVILLDERGRDIKSEGLADIIATRMVDGVKRVVFIIGGAYGVSESVFERANYTWKLSSLVFPHQLVRIILVEQLYRALTIIKGEKYHHE